MARDTSLIGNCNCKEAKKRSLSKKNFYTAGVDLVPHEGEGREGWLLMPIVPLGVTTELTFSLQ